MTICFEMYHLHYQFRALKFSVALNALKSSKIRTNLPAVTPSHLQACLSARCSSIRSTYQVSSLSYFPPALGGPEIWVGKTEPGKGHYVKGQWTPDFCREGAR